MPRSIELSDATHTRLIHLMGPNDTTESTVLRLLDFYEGSSGGGPVTLQRSSAPSDGKLCFTGATTPDLTHTKVLKAQIDGLDLPKAKWNIILSHIAVNVFKGKSANDMVPFSGIVRGKKTDSGYKHYPKANISIQGQDANDAWRMSVELAKMIDVDIEVVCEWRDKPAAAHPGKRAVLVSK